LGSPTAQPEPQYTQTFNGALTGNLAVGPSGASTYTVPINTPPGIAAMAPNLSLVYSSQGGDGIAGQGWELAGLSMIHRCPLTRVQDGVARPVMMNGLEPPNPPATPPPTAFDLTTDGLCLDGQRLFPREDGTHHLEREDNSVIKGHAAANIGVAPQWFTVETKTGETRYYGLHGQARVIYAGGAYPGEPEGTTAVWALDRVVDAWGNYFDIQYN